MTINRVDALKRALEIVLKPDLARGEKDIAEVRFLQSEARAVVKLLEEKFPRPPAHSGPHSGTKPSMQTAKEIARNRAARTLRPMVKHLAYTLMGQPIEGMTIAQLQKIAASSHQQAALADKLLAQIGANPDLAALVTDALSRRQINSIWRSVVGERVAEYRDLASRAS